MVLHWIPSRDCPLLCFFGFWTRIQIQVLNYWLYFYKFTLQDFPFPFFLKNYVLGRMQKTFKMEVEEYKFLSQGRGNFILKMCIYRTEKIHYNVTNETAKSLEKTFRNDIDQACY